MSTISEALQKYFGHTSFRPLQEEIITDVLEKKDVFVLMPTGAGKSLCYQLPAVFQTGVTIVISPLIALMKDQVDGLRENGIKAGFLNSSLSASNQQKVKLLLRSGKLSLLYIAPERLKADGFMKFLQQIPIALFAIDEAHCISEWGHDFRKDYRELKKLREVFPSIPVIALTATATDRVQSDIVEQLQLRHAKTYKASFNRPNLHYIVLKKDDPIEQVIAYSKKREGESGIVYCQTRDRVEQVALALQQVGIKALPYHAGLQDDVRRDHQEQFIHDDVSVVVATIAFGMGIDKPNVRFIMHVDLPHNLERYYQETGRAGRDGLASECILLFSYADRETIKYFIDQKETESERAIAYTQLSQMVNFAQSKTCRRKILLGYFDESFSQNQCEACDNCLSHKDTFDGTILAQKILSCIYRLQGGFGINHVANILVGAKTKQISFYHHERLSTYAIVDDYSKNELKEHIGELIALGYIEQTIGKYPTLRLTPKSVAILKGEEKLLLTKPDQIEALSDLQINKEMNQQLFDELRRLRKRLADKKNLPPYMIFPDTTLTDMATYFPQSIEELSNIRGVGELKLQTYGKEFLRAIVAYCEPRSIASQPIRKRRIHNQHSYSSSTNQTVALFRQGLSIEEIAKRREFVPSTIIKHLVRAYLQGEDVDIDKLVPEEKQPEIINAFHELGLDRLGPIKERLGESYSYGELEIVRAKLLREKNK